MFTDHSRLNIKTYAQSLRWETNLSKITRPQWCKNQSFHPDSFLVSELHNICQYWLVRQSQPHTGIHSRVCVSQNDLLAGSLISFLPLALISNPKKLFSWHNVCLLCCLADPWTFKLSIPFISFLIHGSNVSACETPVGFFQMGRLCRTCFTAWHWFSNVSGKLSMCYRSTLLKRLRSGHYCWRIGWCSQSTGHNQYATSVLGFRLTGDVAMHVKQFQQDIPRKVTGMENPIAQRSREFTGLDYIHCPSHQSRPALTITVMASCD